MTIFPAFLEKVSGIDFSFHKFFTSFINSPVGLTVLWTTFLKSVLAVSNPVFVEVFSKFFLYLLDRYLTNGKNPYPLTYFCTIGSIE